MNRIKQIILVALVGLFCAAVYTKTCTGNNENIPEQKQEQLQTKCPVMAGKINKKLFVDFKDTKTGKTYRIYVCCPGCISTIKADPEKYIKKMQDEGVKIETVPNDKR